MQGFVQTGIGLKPVNLSNIQAVNYYKSASQPFVNAQGQRASGTSGSIAIEYIGNNVGVTSSGGNVLIVTDWFEDDQWVVKRFWDWVNAVNGGGINKTLNSFLHNRSIYGVEQFAITNFANTNSFGIKVDESMPIADLCELEFKYDNVLNDFTYETFVTNIYGTFPEYGANVYFDRNRGYAEKGTPLVPEVTTSNSKAPVDGVYAWLSGTPEYTYTDFSGGGPPQEVTSPQAGDIYRVTIKDGKIWKVEICPADFTADNAAGDIDGAVLPMFLSQPPASGCNCYNERKDTSSFGPGCNMMGSPAVNRDDWGWIDVKLGFTQIPSPVAVMPIEEGEGPYVPPTEAECPDFTAGGQSTLLYAAGIPVGAKVWIQDNQGRYVLADANWPALTSVNTQTGSTQSVPYPSLYNHIKVKETFSTTQTITGEGYSLTKTCDWFTAATDYIPDGSGQPNQGNQFIQSGGTVVSWSTACASLGA